MILWFTDISVLCLSAKVKQYLKDSLSSQNTAITLAHMASLEKKLTKHFQVKDFLSLEQGNFLEFLVKHIQVQVFSSLKAFIFLLTLWNKSLLSFAALEKISWFCHSDETQIHPVFFFISGCVQLLQDTLGSTLILGSGSMELAGSGFRPTRQDVFEFITQCGDITSADPDEVSHLKAHADENIYTLWSTKTKLFLSQCCDFFPCRTNVLEGDRNINFHLPFPSSPT